jgi:hypothetical protein
MKIDLSPVKAALKKADAVKTRLLALENERVELLAKIENLEGRVADGEEKAVNALVTAKARLERSLPAAVQKAQTELEAAIHDLRGALQRIPVQTTEAFNAEFRRVKAIFMEFLREYMEPYFVEDFAHNMAGQAVSVTAALNRMKSFPAPSFQPSSSNERMRTVDGVMAIATETIQGLENV